MKYLVASMLVSAVASADVPRVDYDLEGVHSVANTPTLSVRYATFGLERYRFELHEEPGAASFYYRIEIYREGESAPLQVEKLRNGVAISDDDFHVADVDGDGYADICILGGIDSKTKQRWYKMWRYAPATKKFVWAPELGHASAP